MLSAPGNTTMPRSSYTRRYKRIIEVLTTARLDANLTQSEVANYFKRHQSFISKIESSERRIDIIEFLDFCKLYKISPENVLKELL